MVKAATTSKKSGAKTKKPVAAKKKAAAATKKISTTTGKAAGKKPSPAVKKGAVSKKPVKKNKEKSLLRYKCRVCGYVYSPLRGSRIMVFLPVPRLRIFLIPIFARSADFREKARLASGALMNGAQHAISVPCATISMMKNVGNLIVASNPGQNLRIFLKIMSVQSVQQTRKSFYGMEMFSSRVSHPCMNKKNFSFLFFWLC